MSYEDHTPAEMAAQLNDFELGFLTLMRLFMYEAIEHSKCHDKDLPEGAEPVAPALAHRFTHLVTDMITNNLPPSQAADQLSELFHPDGLPGFGDILDDDETTTGVVVLPIAPDEDVETVVKAKLEELDPDSIEHLVLSTLLANGTVDQMGAAHRDAVASNQSDN